ncbi:siderophore ABC transporter substrate-binding protein [Scopulibacillus cellulosilyticus]|uniref:Siderophore ABC transporter substrate-binding protein n=1 Tax=Scopulibacillus cellulosilyticus TaxID=2665665 RepID=A0ABW2Q153_9BACL
MKKLATLLIAAMLAVVLAACGSNSKDTSTNEAKLSDEKLTIKHELGTTEVPKNPKKVVVFDMGALDSLDKLGVNVTGAPKDGLPSYLSKYKNAKYENVGGLKEPDFEKVDQIHPDLIIISGRQANLYDKFKKIAPTIYLGVDAKNYMKSFKNNAETLGEIFDKKSEVDKQLTKIDDQIKALHDKAAKSDKKGLIILANDGKASAYGEGSRFGLIHDVFGVKPADKNIKASIHGQSISFEYILDKNPDYLFVVDRGAVVGGKSSAKQVVENAIVKKTKAYKEHHIVYLNPNYWYLSGGGLISVPEMVKEVADGIK